MPTVPFFPTTLAQFTDYKLMSCFMYGCDSVGFIVPALLSVAALLIAGYLVYKVSLMIVSAIKGF
jgi:hypothetical protein